MLSPAVSTLLLALGATSYAIAAVVFFLEVLRAPLRVSSADLVAMASAERKRGTRGLVLLFLGASFHFAYMTVASFIARVCPVHAVHFILSVIAIFASFVYVGTSFVWRRRQRGANPLQGAPRNLDALGLVIAPLGLAFLLGTHLMGRPETGPSLGAPFLVLHVLVNLVGVAMFVLAGAAAVLYLIHERRLKHKRAIGRFRLPPLDTLDQATHRFLLIGFPLLTLGILSGTFWARDLELGLGKGGLRIVLSYATWLLFAGVLLLRTAAGWRGRRSAYGVLLGLTFALGVITIYLLKPTEPKVANLPHASEVVLSR